MLKTENPGWVVGVAGMEYRGVSGCILAVVEVQCTPSLLQCGSYK